MKKESFDIIHIRPSAAMYGCLFILALVFFCVRMLRGGRDMS